MKKLTRKQWQALPANDPELPNDQARRLRNAMRALVQLDPHWLSWVENNIPRECTKAYRTRMVECRARAIVLARHGWFGCLIVGHMLFRDWPFNDDGNLTPG